MYHLEFAGGKHIITALAARFAHQSIPRGQGLNVCLFSLRKCHACRQDHVHHTAGPRAILPHDQAHIWQAVPTLLPEIGELVPFAAEQHIALPLGLMQAQTEFKWKIHQ